MRLPAVAIAVAFAAGIALGLCPPLLALQASPHFLQIVLTVAAVLIALGVFLLRRSLPIAGVVSLAAWLLLGLSGSALTHQPPPPNYDLRPTDAGTIDLRTPLCWQGTLRDEPTNLPWGTALDIALISVEFQQRTFPIAGGLRVTYSPHSASSASSSAHSAPPLPNLHSGDTVTVVTQARFPQFFRDDGAFDRRAYLRQQGIDLTATLRAPELLEIVASAPPSAKNRLARVRLNLREELSTLLPDAPEEAAVLRAMLLGDRSFLDRSESVNFQKTGVFHVLVVAGLHVGAFAAFLFWLARKFRLSRGWTSLAIIFCAIAYVAVVSSVRRCCVPCS